jgi:dinuclear metal center YbgI/SA1388 family protein
MKIVDLVSAVEVFAAPELQEDYDNCGLLTGNAQWECTGVICTLDITMEVLAEAKQKNCNLIIAHHPIIFKGLKKITGKNYVESIVIDAIKNDIAIYAAHTNLDNVLLGVNGMIARKLGLKNTSILLPKDRVLRRLITFAPHDKAEEVRQAVFAAGAGKIGNYGECSFNTRGIGTFKAEEGADPYVGEIGQQHQEEETKIEIVFPFYLESQVVKALEASHPYEVVAYDIFTMENRHLGVGSGIYGELENPVEEREFLLKLREVLGTPVIRHSAFRNRPIQKIALCGGAGSFLIRPAIASGADIYITGDMKYHDFFDAEERILLADPGHYETEQFTVELLYELLVEKFPTFAVLKTSVNTNPVHYFQ